MIIRDFLRWVETAPDGLRAEATSALARAWLYSDMEEGEHRAAEAALVFLLDDPAPEVRVAIAHGLGHDERAPRVIIAALVRDEPDIAAVVLRHSPVVREGELLIALAGGDEEQQCAVAGRSDLNSRVIEQICATASNAACQVLVANHEVDIPVESLLRLGTRFGDDLDLMHGLLRRPNLPLAARHMVLTNLVRCAQVGREDARGSSASSSQGAALQLVAPVEEGETARSLPVIGQSLAIQSAVRQGAGGQVMAIAARGNDTQKAVQPVDVRLVGEKVALHLSGDRSDEEVLTLVEYLRTSGQLTARLLLRALGAGNLRLFTAALSVLSERPLPWVRQALPRLRATALRALLRSCGLPPRCHEVCLAVVREYLKSKVDFSGTVPASDVRLVLECVLRSAGQEALSAGAVADVLQMLDHLSVEAARSEARQYIKATMEAA